MDKTVDFTRGKILLPLIRFALPVLLALFLQAMYGAADLLIAGKFGGASSNIYVSAISSGSQLMHSLTTVVTGLSMGLTVVLATAIGAGRRKEAGRITGSGIVLFALISVIMTVVFVLSARSIAGWLSVPAESFEEAVSYIRICSAGFLFIVAYNLLGSIFRGIGDSVLPLITVAIAALINMGLDYVFIAFFGMGSAGAALATVIAQGCSVGISLVIISKRTLPFEFSRTDIRWDIKENVRILRLGVPLAVQDFLVSLSFLIVLMIVNSLGLIASAGVGVAEKVVAFIMLVPSAYMQSMAAFVGQNIGAGKEDRAKKALFYGIATSLAAGVVMGALSYFRGDVLAGIFSDQSQTINAAATYLKAYAIDCLLVSFLFCLIGYFNGCEKTTFVMIQGLVGGILIRIPVSWLFSQVTPPNLFLIGLATPTSSIVQISLCGLYFLWLKKRRALTQ